MDKFPTSVEVAKELASIEGEIARLQERQALLLKFLDLANQVVTKKESRNIQPQNSSNLAKHNGHRNVNVVLAERILAQIGPLSVQRLVEEMLKNGLEAGADDNLRIWHRIRKTLISHPDVFQKHGRGLWDVKPEKQLTERRKFIPETNLIK
jgi:hypothetical protein